MTVADLEDQLPRSRRRPGIRIRILAWYVVLLSLATAVTIGVERNALLNRLDQRVQAELEQELDEFYRLIGGEAPDGSCLGIRLPDGTCEVGLNPETGEPFGSDMAAAFDVFLRRSIPGEHETMVTFLDGRLHADSIERRPVELRELPAFTEAAATVTERKQADLDTEVGLIRYLAAPVGPPEATAVFVVAQFLEPQLAEVRASLRIAAVANLIVLGMASVLAYLAAGRLLRPVRAVTETATAISESDLTQRIPVEGDDEISELARTFNSMLDRLEEAFASQRRFFDDAGHELRTPITIVRGNLELLPSEPEARKRALRVVDDELERMSRLVQDLLTLAKSGRPDFVTLVEVDVQRVVVDAFERVSGLAPRQWLTRIGDAATFGGDADRLVQALVQLATNAVAHTEPGDTIELGCDADEATVRLWVGDTGIGIAEGARERIFARFDRGPSPRGEGTGLGLSIVTEIARAHGGEVELDSEVGVGSRFTLRLPRRPMLGDGGDR
jgi:two-component system, OmpR family, sensor kinase